MLGKMGCDYYYGVDICKTPAEEDNYEVFLRLPSTREAIHTGNLPFGSQSGDVYYSMLDVFMASERETVEFLLERYPVRKLLKFQCNYTNLNVNSDSNNILKNTIGTSV